MAEATRTFLLDIVEQGNLSSDRQRVERRRRRSSRRRGLGS